MEILDAIIYTFLNGVIFNCVLPVFAIIVALIEPFI